jgi:hypothetical protein
MLAVVAGRFHDSAWAATGPLDANAAIETTADPALTGVLPDAATADKPAGRVMTGNPLWAVPLSSLSVTRERPLFSPSRRPPAPAVVAVSVSAAAPPPKPAEPDHPLLTLVGTIIGEAESIGIFADQATNKFIRLKTGQAHAGWTLRAIAGREAIFEKDKREAILVLPARSATVQAGNAAPALSPFGSGSPPPLQPATWRDGDGQLVPPPSPLGH